MAKFVCYVWKNIKFILNSSKKWIKEVNLILTDSMRSVPTVPGS